MCSCDVPWFLKFQFEDIFCKLEDEKNIFSCNKQRNQHPKCIIMCAVHANDFDLHAAFSFKKYRIMNTTIFKCGFKSMH